MILLYGKRRFPNFRLGNKDKWGKVPRGVTNYYTSKQLPGGTMHYKNGREAHNGDKVMVIPINGNPFIGILYDAVAGNDYCNGRVVHVHSKSYTLAAFTFVLAFLNLAVYVRPL